MVRELKDTCSYSRVIAVFSVLTFLFGIGVSIVGELLLPLASAFLATLFLFENPKKRFMSYVCPISSIVCSVLIKGLVALISIEYVILALIIAFCYKKSLSKAEASIYITFTVAVFVFISLYLSAAVAIESFSFTAVKGHYFEIFLNLKRYIVESLSAMAIATEDGASQILMSVEESEIYFATLTNSFIALVAIFAFSIAGLTLKIYTALVLKYAKHGILKTFAHFLPSNICAYSYIASTALYALSDGKSKFALVLLNVNTILMAVFLYMGIRYILMLRKAAPKKSTITLIIIVGLISFPTLLPSVISYLGIWVVLGVNSHNKTIKD